MTPEQTFEPITIEGLPAKVGVLRQDGWRLVQISATRLPEHMELTYSFDLKGLLANYRLHLPVTGARIPSITSIYWCAFLYENEMHDLFDIQVDGMAVDFHGTLYKTAVKFPFGAIKAPVAKPAAPQSGRSGSNPHRTTLIRSMARTIIPFGPQHPVLPEPVHLDLVVEDERVVEARPSIGFIHRGLEKLVEKKDFIEFVYIAERVCGICSFIHGQTYCQAIEAIMNLPVPPRAHYLRTIWGELSRIHSHLLWLGLMADAVGFENLFMHSWRVRERVLNIIEATTGGRVIFGSCKVGGVRRDIDAEGFKRMGMELDKIEQEIRDITKVFFSDSSVKARLCGVGVLSRQDAYELGCVGPTLRASGVAQDMRTLGYAAFKDLAMQPITRTEGDSHARCSVRCDELFQSIDLIRQAITKIPEGEIAVKVTGNPNGEYVARTEQPRGEVAYCVKANGSKNLQRFRVRTPTFANLPALVKMLQGCELADVPVLVLTIDPCISCTER